MQSNVPTSGETVSTKFLMRFVILSIIAAVVTVSIKFAAAWITGSVGFLSDALESIVNLVAALVALWALMVSGKPADHNHDFGHGKAEYMSSLVEGALIFVAAAGIIVTSIQRLVHPQPLEEIGIGLLLSVVATVVNLVVGLVLLRQGRKHRSITLEADGHHLLTDVWTTVVVPGHWTVGRSHDLADDIEAAVDRALPECQTVVHIEPGPSDFPAAAASAQPPDPDHPSI